MNSLHVQPTGWLFTRGDASVRMTIDEQAPGTVLIVRGPGTAAATYEFPNLSALMTFAAVQEEKLREDGFQLQAIAERRSADRPQTTPERRRR